MLQSAVLLTLLTSSGWAQNAEEEPSTGAELAPKEEPSAGAELAPKADDTEGAGATLAPKSDGAKLGETPEPEAKPEPPPVSELDYGPPRGRRHIAFSLGSESVSDDFNTVKGLMYGLDFGLGAQFNDLFGFYVPVLLSFGELKNAATDQKVGLTGTLAVTGVVDATIANRAFAGIGGGLGILNNPMGPALHIRMGGYPLAKAKEKKGKGYSGLMVAFDYRVIFTGQGNASYPALTVGHAAF